VSLCVESAPCGRYADQILSSAGVTLPESSVSRGADARATLRAVAEGDAVAAIVYATDALSAGDRVDTLDLGDPDGPIADYLIAVVAGPSDTELARAFTAYVRSDAGRTVLERAGFLAP
jgi:molybdate transport system substrate-binding protein